MEWDTNVEKSGLSRRQFIERGVIGAAALTALPTLLAACGGSSGGSGGGGGTTNLKVLALEPPDPTPPGGADFALDALKNWESTNKASVSYDTVPYTQIHDKIATAFASGNSPWDVSYMAGWAPEFSNNLVDIGPMLSQAVKDDMPESSFKTTTWDGKTMGAVFTLSLQTLFYNTELLEAKGIKEPPKNWEELLGYTKELTGDGVYGWVNNYGTPEGIGGTANYWMAYLQQAGGTMYDEAGLPVFNDAPGVDAVQFMVDLWNAGTDPGSISYVGVADVTNVFTAGKAAMTMNWPFTWKPASDPTTSKIAGKLGSAVLPAGAAGTASIDGADAFSVTTSAKDPELAVKLIEFYLSPEAQKEQVLKTGWMPILLSMLADPEVQAAAPNAGTLLEQAKAPYDSFITPDYNEVTLAIGTEVTKAIKGDQSAKDAMQKASDAVTEIVKTR
ncbi:MAG: sugar ABC transporter substrate-binding protein [Thermoleophilia bacterium]